MLTITHEPLESVDWTDTLADCEAGALVVFQGRVRNRNHHRNVTRIDYEIYEELSRTEFERIVEDARRRHDILGVRCAHRAGTVKVGEMAVWIGVAARHRRDAFQACELILNQIKQRLPIWKKETYEDGVSAWIHYHE